MISHLFGFFWSTKVFIYSITESYFNQFYYRLNPVRVMLNVRFYSTIVFFDRISGLKVVFVYHELFFIFLQVASILLLDGWYVRRLCPKWSMKKDDISREPIPRHRPMQIWRAHMTREWKKSVIKPRDVLYHLYRMKTNVTFQVDNVNK